MSTSRRKVLELPEILFMVFEFAIQQDANPLRAPKTATLARAARVCRTFSGPALETLWQHIESFIPLARLLSCAHRANDELTSGKVCFALYPMKRSYSCHYHLGGSCTDLWSIQILSGDVSARVWIRFT